MSGKIKALKQVAKIIADYKSKGKTVGLITGCFDIVHIGHIKQFTFAKKRSDIVIVGLESDQAIRFFKGESRPIYTTKQRLMFLSSIEQIDFVFELKHKIKSIQKSDNYYLDLYKNLLPDFLFTNSDADPFWKQKQKNVRAFGIKLIINTQKRDSSSTHIINNLLNKEF